MSIIYSEIALQTLAEKMRELERDYACLLAKLAQTEALFQAIQAAQASLPPESSQEAEQEDTGQAII